MLSATMVQTWAPPSEDANAASMIKWIRESLIQVSNVTMPRTRSTGRSVLVYWWNAEISVLRDICISCRRRYTKTRRRSPPEVVARLGEDLRLARRSYKKAIGKAKSHAWDELLKTLEEDPWERSYCVDCACRLRRCARRLSQM